MADPEQPLIVQSDHSVLLEVHNPRAGEARLALCRFAELLRSPEHIHTYRLTRLSLWNAAAAGMTAEQILSCLADLSKYPLPLTVVAEVNDAFRKYGAAVLEPDEDEGLILRLSDDVLDAATHHRITRPLLQDTPERGLFRIPLESRGHLKRALTSIGIPVHDRVGFEAGDGLSLELRARTLAGEPFSVRPYQAEAASRFYADGDPAAGHGVIVLPCGAGKTVIALAAMALVGEETLVLTTSVSAARQWIRELLDKTTLTADQVGEYTGQRKVVRPVTVTTYSLLTHRKRGETSYPHLGLFDAARFGLVVYDEVHLLPAPIFRATAGIQARRRLGLTATLVREDGNEEDVFSLIGPKRYELPWRKLEDENYVAEAICREVRVALPRGERAHYDSAEPRDQHRIAATSATKIEACRALLANHPDEPALVLGFYVDQLERVAAALGAPLVTGATPIARREELLLAFRDGRERLLILSNIGNFSLDLPQASVAVQLSGTFGSRQEEAQRLGRLLRPKDKPVTFYSLVSRDTCEQRFALHRQLFLTEQGYRYEILDWSPSEQKARSNVIRFPGGR